MLIDAIFLAGGLALLLGAAYFLVSSAVTISLTLGISRVIVGATAVAFGTSAPEFLVSFIAGIEGADGVALGNILGSNVANVALVLGIAAVIAPMSVHQRVVRWEIPALVVATAGILLAGAGGSIERWEGAPLFVMLLLFIVLSLRLFPDAAATMAEDAESSGAAVDRSMRALMPQIAMLTGSVVALAVGAQLAVAGSTGIAESLGISEFVIGVTVIAVGTSLPELVTSVVAAIRREHDIAVANIVGSNIFNLLGVIGLTGALVPLAVDPAFYRFEMLALAASTLILIPLAWPRYRIGRIEGLVLLAVYAAFTVLVIVRGGGG
jgi:cation:H+ antiporter